MAYAKIDEQGNVTEFPYRIERFQDIPEDAIEVDVLTLRPDLSWNQKLMYDSIIKNEDNTYTLSYIADIKFSTLEDKQKWIKVAVEQNKKQNEKTFKNKVSQLKTGYSEEEILSWDQQAKEAAAYLLDNSASVPLIEKMAENRNVTLTELATRISEKTDMFTNTYGAILGIYQKNNDILDSIDLEDETTFNSIDLYGWN